MSSEILSVLEYMEKEKGIPRDEMIAVITNSIKTSSQKGVQAGRELRTEINPRTGALKAWAQFKVTDTVSDPKVDIHLEKARLLKPDAQIGDIIEKEMDPSELGRIAAQAARQSIMQRVRQFEKERIYDDYKDSVGDIVSGTVRRREKGDLVIDLGKAEAVLRHRDRVPGEDFAPGDLIRCLLVDIENTPRGPEIVLSRSSVNFVRRLLELEVTEINDGTVTIQSIAREPGFRTKLAVETKDQKVDPVGACVGSRGARVKSIVRELGGERVDIIRHHDDPVLLLHEAIKPALAHNVRVDQANRRIYFEVAEADLATAIGRKGQNAKLTAKLIGWRLDITKLPEAPTGLEAKLTSAAAGWQAVPGIGEDIAAIMVRNGIVDPSAFEGVNEAELMDLGLTAEQAASVVAAVRKYRS